MLLPLCETFRRFAGEINLLSGSEQTYCGRVSPFLCPVKSCFCLVEGGEVVEENLSSLRVRRVEPVCEERLGENRRCEELALSRDGDLFTYPL